MRRDVIELTASDIDRFFSNIRKEPNGCWIWCGPVNKVGGYHYGNLPIAHDGYKTQVSCRLISFMWHFGKYTKTKLGVSCGNPMCVSPEHILELTTWEKVVNVDYGVVEGGHVHEGCQCTGKRCPECNRVLCIEKFGKRPYKRSHKLLSYCYKCLSSKNKKRKYRLSDDELHALLTQVKCEVCGVEINGSDINIDHNHFTNKVRGTLCGSCNARVKGIDDPVWMAKVKPYLKKYNTPLIDLALSIDG